MGQIGKMPRLLAMPSIVTEKEDAGLRFLNSWTPTASAIIKSAAVRTAGTRGNALREGSRSWDGAGDRIMSKSMYKLPGSVSGTCSLKFFAWNAFSLSCVGRVPRQALFCNS